MSSDYRRRVLWQPDNSRRAMVTIDLVADLPHNRLFQTDASGRFLLRCPAAHCLVVSQVMSAEKDFGGWISIVNRGDSRLDLDERNAFLVFNLDREP
jgi:hypothetical protein